MKVLVIGSGYVGLVAAACFAEGGNEVLGVDVDAAKVARLRKGESPIYEPGLDDLFQLIGAHSRLDLNFRQEIHNIFGTPIELGMSFLAAESLDLGDGDPLHADGGKSLAYLVKLERFDDGSDEFHGAFLISK